jgi:hypothetical protein
MLIPIQHFENMREGIRNLHPPQYITLLYSTVTEICNEILLHTLCSTREATYLTFSQKINLIITLQ